jgi:(+)-trans-carveol dehydrogenase
VPGKLEGKVALITGAARGQGRSHAVRLAEEGADILAIDIAGQLETVPYPMSTPSDLEHTVKVLESMDRRVVARQVDVRDGEALTAAVNEGVAELGRLDIAVANAGILSIGASFQLTEAQWSEMVDVNLGGVWRTTKAAIPHLMAAGAGSSLVLISSLAGLRGQPGIGHYVAAKHGVVGLMKTIALELGPMGIRVNAILPSQVDTEMIMNEPTYRVFLPDHPAPTREDFAVPSAAMHVLPIPWIEAIDVSNALLFLVSDDGRYIHGVALPVDGGAGIK